MSPIAAGQNEKFNGSNNYYLTNKLRNSNDAEGGYVQEQQTAHGRLDDYFQYMHQQHNEKTNGGSQSRLANANRSNSQAVRGANERGFNQPSYDAGAAVPNSAAIAAIPHRMTLQYKNSTGNTR